MNDNKLYIFCLLSNLFYMICWTAIAIHFNKWWLVFFSLLFFDSIQTKTRAVRVCDKCGKRSPPADDSQAAIRIAESQGWEHIKTSSGMELDYCPECKDNVGFCE